MNRQQKLVRDFNRAIETPNRSTPGMPSAEVRLLRARLILEEALEVIDSLGFCLQSNTSNPENLITGLGSLIFQDVLDPKMDAAIDGLCDLKYVTDGTADALGVDLESFFEEVHHTNMQKLNGPKDANGKQLKPEGWRPPRIAEMLRLIDGMPQDMHVDILAPMLAGDKNESTR